MKEKRYRFLVWKCTECDDKITSDRGTRHQMDTCKCGKASVDAEDVFDRYMGPVKFLKQYETEVDGSIVKEYLHDASFEKQTSAGENKNE